MLQKLILHHNDRDGYMSAAVIINYFNSIQDVICYNISMNHTKPIISYINDAIYNIDDYDEIFVVDYGISLKEDHDFMKKYANKIVWIDHHYGSMIDPMNEDLKDIFGFRCNGISGALLTWAYFYDYAGTAKLIKSANANVTQKMLDERMEENETWYNMPKTIWYTHRYDTWDINSQVESFNFGYYIDNLKCMVNDLKYLASCNTPYYQDEFISRVIKRGFEIRNYTIENNESFIRQFGILFTLRFNGKCYKALQVNMPMPSSIKFGRYVKDVEVLLPFYYTGDGYAYSLYKTDLAPEELDVSEIAKLFNGGGHKNAAGFFIHKRDMQIRPSKGAIYSIDE